MALRRALLSAAALAGALATLNTPAAQAHYSQCPSGHFRVWRHSSHEGRFFSSNRGTPDVGSHMNDRTTSFWNRSNRAVCPYRHENHGDDLGCYAPGASPAAMRIHNDQLTSFRFQSVQARPPKSECRCGRPRRAAGARSGRREARVPAGLPRVSHDRARAGPRTRPGSRPASSVAGTPDGAWPAP